MGAFGLRLSVILTSFLSFLWHLGVILDVAGKADGRFSGSDLLISGFDLLELQSSFVRSISCFAC